jgi:cytochrome c551/c552
MALELFSLFRYGLAAALLVYLPYLGVLIGGTTASLVLNFIGREDRNTRSTSLSRELIETAAFDNRVLYAAALLPFPLIGFLCRRILHEPDPLPWLYWILPFGALLPGCVLFSLYRSAVRRTADPPVLHFRAGAAGLLAVLSASFLLFVLLGTLFDPDKLSLIRKNTVYILSWNSLAAFLLFLALSFGLTGGTVLLFLGHPPAGREEPDPDYRQYVRSIGSSLALGGAFAVPVLVVLDLLSLPSTSLSLGVFAASAAVLLLALSVVLVLYPAPEDQAVRPGARVSTAYLLMFLALIAGNQAAVGSAALGRPAPSNPPAAGIPGEVRYREMPPAAEPALEKGRTVFQHACRACHLFETRIVGPPLSKVLPKYKGDFDRLKSYIRDPVKVSPDYPLMPSLGLKEEEIDAVARYLLKNAGEKMPPGKPAAALPAVERGKAVFETVCAGCHRFETRLVGPPFHEVVPKYGGNVEQLKGFIRNPVKVNPGYPAMPMLGLKEEEIDAVAHYLLTKVKRGG